MYPICSRAASTASSLMPPSYTGTPSSSSVQEVFVTPSSSQVMVNSVEARSPLATAATCLFRWSYTVRAIPSSAVSPKLPSVDTPLSPYRVRCTYWANNSSESGRSASSSVALSTSPAWTDSSAASTGVATAGRGLANSPSASIRLTRRFFIVCSFLCVAGTQAIIRDI